MTANPKIENSAAIRVSGMYKNYRKHSGNISRILDFASYLLLRRRLNRFFEVSEVLRDINITVHKGRTLGIIGQNGSGKSTFLKIIASIIKPTKGQVEIKGRVASIIELGAGFNPDDTGIQNIISYLAMYDIPSNKYEEKTKEIISFSGLGLKINEPVKTYSSGMVVRLAFAIIANIDADILLVDEALSVGDAVFAQKCIGFIKDFKRKGTILFVSHDLNALQSFCDEVIWVHEGEIRSRGKARSVCDEYLEFTLTADYPELARKYIPKSSNSSMESVVLAEYEIKNPISLVELNKEIDLGKGFGGDQVEITDVYMKNVNNNNRSILSGGEFVELVIRINTNESVPSPIIGFLVKNNKGVEIFGENTLNDLESSPLYFESNKEYEASFKFEFPLLPSGDYTLSVAVADGDFYKHQQLVWRNDVLVLRIAAERFRYGLLGVKGTQVSVSNIKKKEE